MPVLRVVLSGRRVDIGRRRSEPRRLRHLRRTAGIVAGTEIEGLSSRNVTQTQISPRPASAFSSIAATDSGIGSKRALLAIEVALSSNQPVARPRLVIAAPDRGSPNKMAPSKFCISGRAVTCDRVGRVPSVISSGSSTAVPSPRVQLPEDHALILPFHWRRRSRVWTT
jgi:hypothetical protein